MEEAKEMKALTFVICVTIIAVLTVGTCGCTSLSNVTKSGVAPSVSPPPENLTTAIDNFYKQKNFTVNLPSYITKKGDTVTYHILVTDPQTVAPRYLTNVTVVLTSNSTAAGEAYNITNANFNAQTAIYKSYHLHIHVTSPGETSSLVLYSHTVDSLDYLNEADMSKYYQVTSSFGTPITT